jgi:hypothetical protein
MASIETSNYRSTIYLTRVLNSCYDITPKSQIAFKLILIFFLHFLLISTLPTRKVAQILEVQYEKKRCFAPSFAIQFLSCKGHLQLIYLYIVNANKQVA